MVELQKKDHWIASLVLLVPPKPTNERNTQEVNKTDVYDHVSAQLKKDPKESNLGKFDGATPCAKQAGKDTVQKNGRYDLIIY